VPARAVQTMTSCSLLDAWGLAVQGLLGIGALSTLAYKRQLETPRRPFRVWLFDTSKQAISSGVGHLQNVGLSELVFVRIQVARTSPCVWYLVNLIFDTSLGTCVSYYLLRSAEVALSTCADSLPTGCTQALLEMASTGHYGTPPSASRWASQVFLWLLVVTLAKAVVSALILMAAAPLHAVGLSTLRPLEPYPRLEVVIVMLIAPLLLNVIQLWIQDNFLQLRPFSARGTKAGIICVAVRSNYELTRGSASGGGARGASAESRSLIARDRARASDEDPQMPGGAADGGDHESAAGSTYDDE
jgi:hypothetical protein